MAKNFSSREAKDLIAKHKSLEKSLIDVISLEESLKSNIKNSADSLAMQEILKVLRGIPVDELSRYKKGLRTKPLIDHGYTFIADIYALSIYNLANIKGISQDNAYTIKRIVGDIVDKTRKETKIKLSVDNKNKERGLPAAYNCCRNRESVFYRPARSGQTRTPLRKPGGVFLLSEPICTDTK